MIGLLMCRSQSFEHVKIWEYFHMVELHALVPSTSLKWLYLYRLRYQAAVNGMLKYIYEMSLCAYYYLMRSFIREVSPGKLHFYFSSFLFIPVLKAECQSEASVGAAAGREVDRPVDNNETTPTCAWIHAQKVSVPLSDNSDTWQIF